MIKNDELFVLEFNVRFGDPETQVLLPLLDEDLLLIMENRIDDNFKTYKLKIQNNFTVGIVLPQKVIQKILKKIKLLK